MDGILSVRPIFTPCFLLLFILISRGASGKDLSDLISPQPEAQATTEEPAIDLSQPGTWGAFRSLANARKGDNMEGITKLKRYFLSFGYLNSEAIDNNTADFYDESLESAVKLYQRAFALPVTGNLDNLTLSQIMASRCGVEDVINGTSTMISGHNRSLVQHYSFFSGRPTWPLRKRTLTYAFSPFDKAPDMNETGLRTAFSRAFNRWAEVIPLKFRATENYFSADIKIGFFSGNHGDGKPFDGPLGTLAHGFSPQDGKLHLDAAEQWSFNCREDKSKEGRTDIDLESIATHEIGHVLGLGHSSVKGAVMYPTIRPRTRRVILLQDDVDGAQALYGANPNFDPSLTSYDPEDQYTENGVAVRNCFSGFCVFVILWVLSWEFILWL